MGACGSKDDDGRLEEEKAAATQSFSHESSFYGKITQHNPRNAAGERVTVTDVYEFDEEIELGASSTGVVCQATRIADGEQFALKVIHLSKIDEENREQLRSEIAILKSLDHPNIVKLFETYEQDNVLYMIMELCTGGELYGRLAASGKRFNEKVASRIVKQMLSAVVYCHSKNIAHRDIKMANFLFKDDTPDAPVKMIDFGYSKMMYKMGASQRLETFVGTSYFIAPEVIAGAYSEKADIWSIGVMCFLMVVGYAPFRGKTAEEIIDNVKKAKINWNTPRWKQMSKACLNFTKALLTVQENKRLSAEEALRHEWLQSSASDRVVPHFSDQMLVNISNFADTARLKQLAKVVIAHCAPRDYVQPYHDAFFAIDFDHSGRIDKEELVAALMEHNELDKATADGIFDAIDYDGNGTIRFSEFVAAGIGDTFTEAHMRDAFKRLCQAPPPIPTTSAAEAASSAPGTPATPATPATATSLSSGSTGGGGAAARGEGEGGDGGGGGGAAATNRGEAEEDEVEHVPLERVSSVVDKVITAQSLHDAYMEHDLEVCEVMIAEAAGGKECLSYPEFVQFMRAADSIVLPSPSGASDDGSSTAQPPPSPTIVLTAKRSSSRPELLRQISGVVANKPSSSKRRESLRRMSSPHLAAAVAHDALAARAERARSAGEISSGDDDEVIEVVEVTTTANLHLSPAAASVSSAEQRAQRASLETIASVGAVGTPGDGDYSDGGGSGGGGSSPAMTPAGAVELGRSAGAAWARGGGGNGGGGGGGSEQEKAEPTELAAARVEGRAAGTEHARGQRRAASAGVSFGPMDFSTAGGGGTS